MKHLRVRFVNPFTHLLDEGDVIHEYTTSVLILCRSRTAQITVDQSFDPILITYGNRLVIRFKDEVQLPEVQAADGSIRWFSTDKMLNE